jgi:hypothetical protein
MKSTFFLRRHGALPEETRGQTGRSPAFSERELSSITLQGRPLPEIPTVPASAGV